MPRLRGLAPVVAADTQVVVLGSFPSSASLAARQYYAHPRNQFWLLMGGLLGEDLVALPYPERLRRVLARQLGIWDVIASCERTGSLDSAIRAPRANPAATLLRSAPHLRGVVFNGQRAAVGADLWRAAGLGVAVAPSTSPAHAGMRVDEKARRWQEAIEQATGGRCGRGRPAD
jgi:hypoxanthine-DNA glycosylase